MRRRRPKRCFPQSLDDFSLGNSQARFTESLARLYGMEANSLGGAGRETLDALRRIDALRNTVYRPSNGADYGSDDFSRGLLQIARLTKSRVGLQAASVDLNGWDSHFGQETVMNPLMVRLTRGLSAFYRDVGAGIDKVTVVVMTEFGRRVEENSAFGTDHGRGGVMFVMGGGVCGGRVLGKWPGLTKEVLEGPGDLPVTTNYRNVLAPILERQGATRRIEPRFSLSLRLVPSRCTATRLQRKPAEFFEIRGRVESPPEAALDRHPPPPEPQACHGSS